MLKHDKLFWIKSAMDLNTATEADVGAEGGRDRPTQKTVLKAGIDKTAVAPQDACADRAAKRVEATTNLSDKKIVTGELGT